MFFQPNIHAAFYKTGLNIQVKNPPGFPLFFRIFTKNKSMKPCILFIMIFSMLSCQTAKVKTANYHTSEGAVELGAIGHSTDFALEKGFSTRAYPKLHNNIRLDVQIVPLTKNLNNLYLNKKRYNQSQPTIAFVDSLAIKPEYGIITISNVNEYISQLNNDEKVTGFLKHAGNVTAISSIAITIDQNEIQKFRQADTYYLINKYDSKYSIALFKNGKQTEILDLNPTNVLAYKLGYFCWAKDSKGRWQIADMNDRPDKCKGKTTSKIKEERETSLFKM